MPAKTTRTVNNRITKNLKASPAQVKAWDKAANDASMSWAAWAMAILDAAAGLSALARHLKNVVKF